MRRTRETRPNWKGTYEIIKFQEERDTVVLEEMDIQLGQT